VTLIRRGRWPLLAIVVAVGLGVVTGVWIVRSVLDPNAGARQLAVTYTYARLTQDYSTWWDSVATTCRPASTKDQWITEIRTSYQGLGVQPDPPSTQVQVVSTHAVGNLLQMDVHIAPPAPLNSADVEVDVQQVNGSWAVVGYGFPGDTSHCGVVI
jgi:hypothetical protein